MSGKNILTYLLWVTSLSLTFTNVSTGIGPGRRLTWRRSSQASPAQAPGPSISALPNPHPRPPPRAPPAIPVLLPTIPINVLTRIPSLTSTDHLTRKTCFLSWIAPFMTHNDQLCYKCYIGMRNVFRRHKCDILTS